MVSITEKAAIELQNILKKENRKGCGLRIFTAGFGCSGPQYGLALEEKAADEDKVTESNGVKIFLDENMDALLSGAEIDYIETEYGSGFVINNPNAASDGCGSSCGGCD
ncbi:MAG: iron-sulfur cluster assembly accessory protein [Euryarchaeota archaeon]|nr:iron-sulfur cluster assembly accessory protein [Euryarchaeota archaeon]